MSHRGFLFYLFICAFFALNGCLLPPTTTDPRYLEESEFQILSNLSKAKQLARSGRLEAAETLYRDTLRQSPENVIALNDLGFLLLQSSRFDESEETLREAVSLEPLFLAARINLARVYAETNRLDLAILNYNEVEDVLYRSDPATLKRIGGDNALVVEDLGLLHRLRAGAYYLSGEYDEAVCESHMANQKRGSIREAQIHARLLMSLEYIGPAYELLRSAVLVHQGVLPDTMMFDYGLTLVALQQYASAKAIFERVLAAEKLDEKRRIAARLFRNYLNTLDQEPGLSTESDPAASFVLEKVCAVSEFDKDGYWPHDASVILSTAQKEVCGNDGSAA